MTPEDAVRVHRDVRGRRLFPVHWGTFDLAYHDWFEPIEALATRPRLRAWNWSRRGSAIHRYPRR